MVICPTLASNDAPCSALSVIYTPEGVSEGVEFFPTSPAIVAVDTRIVAEAPVRYLVAGLESPHCPECDNPITDK